MKTSEAFTAAKSENRGVLVGYLPAGYPSVAGGIDALRAMVDSGVDVVEVGLPYSDPLMDGPVIQHAADVALRGGTVPADVLRTVEAIASMDVPTLVMSYWNPIDRYGPEAFARDLTAAGGAGVITPDLIPDDASEWICPARAEYLDTVFLVAPSSTDKRIALTTDACRGFVYAASTMGVTGTRSTVASSAQTLVRRVRDTTELPVSVGLGVSTQDQATEVASYADGVIVGSAFVRRLVEANNPTAGIAAVAELAAELAEGVRSR